MHAVCAVGEFGVVYRAVLLKKQGMNRPGFVAAVKTMRGTYNCLFLSVLESIVLFFSSLETQAFSPQGMSRV